MAWEKRNDYVLDQNIMNMSYNVDDNRLSNDQTNITVNFTTTPATITIKQGSLIEVNGNNYARNTDDFTFQMANATDNYITITDSPGPALVFSSASIKGTFDAQKQGYYQAGNTTRTLKWFIDQTRERYRSIISMNEPFFLTTDETDHLDHFAVTMSADQNIVGGAGNTILNFDTVLYDAKSMFNLGLNSYVASETGYYKVSFHTNVRSNAATDPLGPDLFVKFDLLVNGGTKLQAQKTFLTTFSIEPIPLNRNLYLSAGDRISVIANSNLGTTTVFGNEANIVLSVDRMF